ncbi:MAG: DUF99 family protein [Candidatus Aenigmatarchaeota archaeon]
MKISKMSIMIKREVRVIGWDDTKFERNQKDKVTLIGVIVRGGSFLDGMLTTKVAYDGLDATEKIAKAINNSRHKDQLRYIMTNGISFAGFNLVDIKELYKFTNLPTIAIMRKMPNIKKFIDAMKIFDDFEKRKEIVKNAGKIYFFQKKRIYYQKSGISKKEAEELIAITATHSNVPEPIRLAHIIASGLSGESKGRA